MTIAPRNAGDRPAKITVATAMEVAVDRATGHITGAQSRVRVRLRIDRLIAE